MRLKSTGQVSYEKKEIVTVLLPNFQDGISQGTSNIYSLLKLILESNYKNSKDVFIDMFA